MNKGQAKDYIKSQLADYLQSKGVDLKKNFTCLNPEHIDKNPSMNFDRKRNKVHCFSCGADYDMFDIVGIDTGKKGAELFKHCYELYRIIIDDLNYKHKTIDYIDYYLEANYRFNNDPEAKDYIKNRGISIELANRFKIGYDPEWRSPKAISDGKSPISSKRIIIPTSNHSYLARAIEKDTDPKYKAIKEGTATCFNLEALNGSKPVFIVEGEIDTLSVIEVGGEAIALGSVNNINKFIEYCKTNIPSVPIILSLDNDDAGKKAQKKLKEEITKLNLSCFEIDINGEYKDPNAALMADKEAFKKKVLEAEKAEEKILNANKDEYIKTSAAFHLQSFIDGIADSVNTSYISTGFNKLDNVLDGGLYEGLYFIGAISSLGKTTLVTQMADQIAKSGTDVLIFSLEMARSELMAKSISRHTIENIMLNKGDIRNAKTTRGITTGKRYQNYSDTEREIITESVNSYAKYASHVYIIEGVGDIGTVQIREAVEKHISFTGNTPIVIIDYIQILAPHNERATDKQNTDKAVMELKRISRDFKTPVIGISSFNRANYREAVTMEAFKESGAVEYSSDVLIGLQLAGAGKKDFDANQEKMKNPRQIELVILKNRNGKTGEKIDFEYHALFNYFEEKIM